jgi:murein L,D-transpeptidase YcbB/YkuD
MKNNGFKRLARKAASIISASLALLAGNSGKAADMKNPDQNLVDPLFNQVLKGKQEKQFVLKLNLVKPGKSLALMHGSHSSHSSHSSSSVSSGHSSHASHTSHASSSVSPSYNPSTYPTYTPSTGTTKTTTPNTDTLTKSILTYYYLGTRTLSLGKEGTDVQELQRLLIKKGYSVPTSGFFDEKTNLAVKSFQKLNGITQDGKVGPTTLKRIQN